MFHFAVPFVLLLSRAGQAAGRNGSLKVAIIVLVAARRRFVVARSRRTFTTRASASAGSTCCCRCRWARSGSDASSGSCGAAPILPIHDPEFDEALGDIIERGGEQPRTAH